MGYCKHFFCYFVQKFNISTNLKILNRREDNIDTKVISKIGEKYLKDFIELSLKSSIKKILKNPELFVLQRDDGDYFNEEQKKITEEFNDQQLENIYKVCETILTRIEENFSLLPAYFYFLLFFIIFFFIFLFFNIFFSFFSYF
jgi:hypothetical protein